jgi:hypothetical protein
MRKCWPSFLVFINVMADLYSVTSTEKSPEATAIASAAAGITKKGKIKILQSWHRDGSWPTSFSEKIKNEASHLLDSLGSPPGQLQAIFIHTIVEAQGDVTNFYNTTDGQANKKQNINTITGNTIGTACRRKHTENQNAETNQARTPKQI